MTEAIETTTFDEGTGIKAPARRRKVKKVRKARAPKQAVDTTPRPIKTSDELSGISATACPAACTPERCVISTVSSCKHPNKASDSGCGPKTMENRARARKLIKHQLIDAKG